ncbi:MAG TPA: formate dehydrogenase accessory protein FdhE [Candidatus Udaeobacter sp.]|jgi:FdhE protein|nr:formate dehydrogenase accessory protein FdhE [Candidatus Udaeobacter sp.]
MTASDTRLQDLKRQHPEWEPWLAVIQETLCETANPKWEAFVPFPTQAQQSKAPLLAGVTLSFEITAVRGWVERLIRVASRGTPKMATLEPAIDAELDVLNLFKASLCQDEDRLKETAVVLGAEPEALQAVATLVPVPFLQVCNRRWASGLPASWMEGYCPVCGAWPAFAEVRGIERSRYFRCGRCGGEWQAHCLFCPYCGMTDHEELVSLVPEKSRANSVIDACKRCLGYSKTFTTLQGSPPTKIILEDLATVDLDVAAVAEGYRRPQGPGYSLGVTITESRRRRRLFA